MCKCVGCKSKMITGVATASRDAIAVLLRREGGLLVDIPKHWRAGPLCFACQAAWSAAISQKRFAKK